MPHFDPRQIPVDGVDSHLPAIPLTSLQPDALRHRFAFPPVWAPELLAEKKFMDRAPMHASVLLPIVMREQPMVLLTERTQHLSTHSGQIAFPGGKADEEDIDASATALREAQEEVGLDPAFVGVTVLVGVTVVRRWILLASLGGGMVNFSNDDQCVFWLWLPLFVLVSRIGSGCPGP